MKIGKLLKAKKIGLLGYGIEGKANHSFLKRIGYNGKINIYKNDNSFNEDILSCEILIKSPGIPRRSHIFIEKAFNLGKITSGTEIFLNNCKGKIIGVTGTKGKSTVSSIVYTLLKAKYGDNAKLIGNIGIPAISETLDSKENDIIVIELSSYQLEDLKGTLLDIGVLTNIFPDHLDYHHGIENYKRAKENIKKISRVLLTGKDLSLIQAKIDKSKFKLKGEHNLQNLKLSVIIAEKLGVENSTISACIPTIDPLDHRLQEIHHKDKIWISDSISTTPESTIEAIKSYKTNLQFIILGGLDRGYNYKNLIKELCYAKNLKAIALMPETQDKIQKEANKLMPKNIKIYKSSDMKQIVKFANSMSDEKSCILLSPAAPSYNQFKNYIEKGKDFIKNVKGL